MPYYLFQISQPSKLDLIKNLQLLGQFENFRAARTEAKKLRADADASENVYKVMFAESQLQAEEQLQEKREKPVLMEYER